jgi:tRNA dimethylallyltransferase
MNHKPKIIIVLGPTATGKSDLAVELALKYNGEIISADSRQVYKGMDLGTGKITKDEMKGVPHYLLDVASPKSIYNVSKYKIKAQKIIADILKRGKLPIICGGTGFYIDAVVNNIVLPEVLPNQKLRDKLEKKTCEQLFAILKKLDPARAKTIDAKNKVRLVRAIEITKSLGKVPKIKNSEIYNPIFIGLDLPDSELKRRINIRLLRRLGDGPPSLKLWRVNMLSEVARLHKQGVSYRQLEKFGLEYRNCALLLQKKITKEQLIQNLEREIFQYAKRQRTWFRRNKKITWYQVRPNTTQKIIRNTKIKLGFI